MFPSPDTLLWIMAWFLVLFALAASALVAVGVVGVVGCLVGWDR